MSRRPPFGVSRAPLSGGNVKPDRTKLAARTAPVWFDVGDYLSAAGGRADVAAEPSDELEQRDSLVSRHARGVSGVS
jgi:hypothetical protein